MVGIQGHVRIGEKYFQCKAPLARVVQCLDVRIAGGESLTLQLLIDPVEKYFHERLAVREAIQLFLLTDKVAVTNGVFDGVKRFDLLARLPSPSGIIPE